MSSLLQLVMQRSSTTQSIPSGAAWTDITMDTKPFDNVGSKGTVSLSPPLFTCAAAGAGTYNISGYVLYTNTLSAGETAQVRFVKNGSTVIGIPSAAAVAAQGDTSGTIYACSHFRFQTTLVSGTRSACRRSTRIRPLPVQRRSLR
jgi:hypothetical protein